MPALFQAVLCFLAAGLARFRRWLTLRRVLHIVALLVILLCLREFIAVSAGDMAFLLGMDWGLVLEVTGVIMLLAARTHTIATAQILRHRLRLAKNRMVLLMRRGRARAFRTRSPASRPPPSSDDEPGAAWGNGIFTTAPVPL
jgi:hypothetical protein